MKKCISYLSIICTLISFSYAQNVFDFDSRKIIQKGIVFHDSSKYEKAVTEYKKVNRNDTNYTWASYELVLSYISNHQDSLAIIVCNDALKGPSDLYPNFLVQKANALDDLKKYDEAVKVYQEGMSKFPLNYTFFFEMGIAKFRQEKYKEAHEYFKKSIKLNPYHANSHYHMALLALKQGKIVPAVLAFNYFLLMENNTQKAMNVISELEKIVQNEIDFKDAIQVEGLSNQDDFSEIEALIKSKIALSNKYKSKTKLNYNLNKLQQLVLEKLAYNKDDNGFYMEFYAPLFEELYKKNHFEPLAYYTLSGAGIKEIGDWIKSHKSASDQFETWFSNYLSHNISTFESEINGKKMVVSHGYADGKLAAMGLLNSSGNEIGYWNYFYSNGYLKSEGEYDADSKRNGIWKFYSSNGKLIITENYKSGLLEGLNEEFYSNGATKAMYLYKNEKLEGIQTLYYPIGKVESEFEFHDGKKNGKETDYLVNGQINYQMQALNGKLEGEYIEHYYSGNIYEKAFFKEGKREGKSITYFEFPQNVVNVETNYEAGIETGLYKKYFPNGKLETSGMLDKQGMKEGIWQEYYKNGVLKSEETYANGKLSGPSKYYNRNGQFEDEFLYKNDMLQEYKAFDATGKIFYQNKKESRTKYDIAIYYQNGNLQREGKITDGKFSGIWKDYDMNGNLARETNYVNGNKEGKLTDIYANKQISEVTEYVADEEHGAYHSFYKNGKTKVEGQYFNGKEAGEWKYYYYNGNKNSVKYYLNGETEGWQSFYAVNGKLDTEEFYELGYLSKLRFYDTLGNFQKEYSITNGDFVLEQKFPNGKIRNITRFKDRKLNGETSYYYPNGKPMEIKNYRLDKLHGDFKAFYSNGNLKEAGQYINGNKHGKYISYFEDGTMQEENMYDFGELDGKSTLYHSNKLRKREYDNIEDDVHGKSNLYAENGDMIIERNFEYDILKSYTYEDKNGKLLSPIEVKNETGSIKSYYKSGILAWEYSLVKGNIEGKRIKYHPHLFCH